MCRTMVFLQAISLLVASCICGFASDVDGGEANKMDSGLLMIDVKTDLVAKNICTRNAAGDGKTDDTECIQSAIDAVKRAGGGVILLPPGTYRLKAVTLPIGAAVVGTDVEQTIIRPIDEVKAFITINGGRLSNLTVYGTPTEQTSGENWIVGTKGLGEGSTAKVVHVLSVRNALEGAEISNVRAFEARYDCLYVRGSRGLRVQNCIFDRAGRNVVSMVGSDEDFVFSNCTFGSHWGLYHFDIEPNDDAYVRDGLIVNCTFDGTKAGERGTDSWGSFLCFSGHRERKSKNVSVIGCRFNKVYVRVRGAFPNVSFLHNEINYKPAFIRIPKNKIGDLPDAVIRGNTFHKDAVKMSDIVSGVTFSGNCIFSDNTPSIANDIEVNEGGPE